MLGLDLWSQPTGCHLQAWAPHAMQFPAELTKGSCVTSRPAELRLICIYFFTAHLFQVSSGWWLRTGHFCIPGWHNVWASSLCNCSWSPPLWAPLTLPASGRDESNLRKEEFVFAQSFRVWSIMVEVLQECAGLARA